MSRHRVPRVGTVGRTLIRSEDRGQRRDDGRLGGGLDHRSGTAWRSGPAPGSARTAPGRARARTRGRTAWGSAPWSARRRTTRTTTDDEDGDDVADGDGVVAAGPEPVSVLGRGRWPGRSVSASASVAGSAGGHRTDGADVALRRHRLHPDGQPGAGCGNHQPAAGVHADVVDDAGVPRRGGEEDQVAGQQVVDGDGLAAGRELVAGDPRQGDPGGPVGPQHQPAAVERVRPGRAPHVRVADLVEGVVEGGQRRHAGTSAAGGTGGRHPQPGHGPLDGRVDRQRREVGHRGGGVVQGEAPARHRSTDRYAGSRGQLASPSAAAARVGAAAGRARWGSHC